MRPILGASITSKSNARLQMAVDARARDVTAPGACASTRLVQVIELLASKPTLVHVRHLILHATFVFRRLHACGVDEQPAHLPAERVDNRRRQRIGAAHHRRRIVWDDPRNEAAEESPRLIEAFTYSNVVCSLVCQPNWY